MFLKHLSLQNFRNYTKSNFTFSEKTTVILGSNTSGKTNLLEAIYFLARGESFKAEKDIEVIHFGEEVARVSGKTEDETLEVVIASNQKKYLVNGVSKRKIDFAGLLTCVIFSPMDLDIIVDSPSLRRRFLDGVLLQVDREYRLASIDYTKALRQRNALLEYASVGSHSEKQFEYWDSLLIKNGQMLTKKREELIAFFNTEEKDIFDFAVSYDKSVVSKERLLQYEDAERAAGVTLVGPHRDDFSVAMFNNKVQTTHDVKLFGSRGQQRLAILQLKLLELSFMEQKLGEKPVLLLDDIFSELDTEHIDLVSRMIAGQQTIITTTHKEFIDKKFLKKANVVELG